MFDCKSHIYKDLKEEFLFLGPDAQFCLAYTKNRYLADLHHLIPHRQCRVMLLFIKAAGKSSSASAVSPGSVLLCGPFLWLKSLAAPWGPHGGGGPFPVPLQPVGCIQHLTRCC